MPCSGARKSAATRGDYRGRLRATIAFSGQDDWVHQWPAKSPATRFDRLPMIRQLPVCPKTGCSRSGLRRLARRPSVYKMSLQVVGRVRKDLDDDVLSGHARLPSLFDDESAR